MFIESQIPEINAAEPYIYELKATKNWR